MPALAALAVVLGALSQAATGFGFSLVAAPFLVAAYGAPRGVQLSLALSIALNAVLLALRRRDAAWRSAGLLLLPATAAVVGVGWLVEGTRRDTLTAWAGGLCLLGVVAVATGRGTARLHGALGTVLAGAASGAMTVVAGIGGPPVVLFGQHARWPSGVARSTLQVFFLGMNAVALVTLGPPADVPPAPVAALAVGLPLGWWVQARLPERTIRPLVLTVAGIGSVLAIERGLG